ncbi:MAG TPA: dihydrolipoamide acetyltransferase family protein [Terriglobia bacterium]|nr:dihydrolipoamide acetyltransferase family protein [Terriglobia bacterium]
MTHSVIMPDLGQTTAEGRIVRWLKKPGDKVAKGDPLLEVETDKVTMEVEAYKGGYLRAVLVEEGQMAGAMSLIALLTDDPEEAYEIILTETEPSDESAQSETTNSVPMAASSTPQAEVSGRPAATPAAKERALALKVDLRIVAGTGPDGLITKRDVEKARKNQRSPKAASSMAAITTRSAAKIPHFFVTVDVEVSNVIQWRERWNAAHPDLSASLNDIFVRAASLALRDVPDMNVHYREGMLEEHTSSDVLLVAATKSGLALVPIADPASSAWEAYLSSMRRTLEEVRQDRIVQSLPHAPALAVSNLGMFKVKQFSAIIPPGCSAILAVGAVREDVIVKNKQLRMDDVCSLTLSSDHRVIDGIAAAKFLERVQAHLNSL